MQNRKLLLFILSLLLINYSFTQNVSEAVKKYSTEGQFDYSPNLIAGQQIRSISEFNTEYGTRYLNAYYEFNKQGNPVYKKNTNRYGDSAVTNYRYDSLHNLVAKTISRRLDDPPYKYAVSDIQEWVYDEKGVLLEQYGYSMIDFIPHENGGAGFPAKMMATKCINYTYDLVSGTVKLEYICRNSKYPLYPHINPAQTVTRLKLFANGKMAEEQQNFIEDGHKREVVQQFDSSGNVISLRRDANIFYRNWLYPVSYKPIEKSRVLKTDSTRHAETNRMEVRYTLKHPMEGIEVLHLAYDPSASLDSVDIRWYADRTKKVVYSFNSTKYEKGKISRVENFVSALSPGNMTGWHGSRGYNPPVDIYSRTVYEYFDNGMVKTITSYNKEGVETRNVFYKIEYYK